MLTPGAKRGELHAALHGDLGTILEWAGSVSRKGATDTPQRGMSVSVVAGARNEGQLDIDALIAGRPQSLAPNPQGEFMQFRVGDAVASRNIHAAIYDSLRLCKEL